MAYIVMRFSSIYRATQALPRTLIKETRLQEKSQRLRARDQCHPGFFVFVFSNSVCLISLGGKQWLVLKKYIKFISSFPWILTLTGVRSALKSNSHILRLGCILLCTIHHHSAGKPFTHSLFLSIHKVWNKSVRVGGQECSSRTKKTQSCFCPLWNSYKFPRSATLW